MGQDAAFLDACYCVAESGRVGTFGPASEDSHRPSDLRGPILLVLFWLPTAVVPGNHLSFCTIMFHRPRSTRVHGMNSVFSIGLAVGSGIGALNLGSDLVEPIP